MQRLVRAASAALLVLGSTAWSSPVTAEDRWVTMFDSEYLPGVVTIRTGDTVTWVNDDDLPHDAVGNGWSTPLLTKGDSAAVTFRRAGTFRYACSIHPAMRGAVRVVGAGVTIPPTDTVADRDAIAPGSPWPVVTLLIASGVLGAWTALRRWRASD